MPERSGLAVGCQDGVLFLGWGARGAASER